MQNHSGAGALLLPSLGPVGAGGLARGFHGTVLRPAVSEQGRWLVLLCENLSAWEVAPAGLQAQPSACGGGLGASTCPPSVCTQLDLLPSSLKLSNEPGPASIYHSKPVAPPVEAGRTALHVACEREDNDKVSWAESMCARASVHVCK